LDIKKRLDSSKGGGAEELLEILWTYRCSSQSSINESPFSLVYDTDVRIMVEIGELSLQR